MNYSNNPRAIIVVLVITKKWTYIKYQIQMNTQILHFYRNLNQNIALFESQLNEIKEKLKALKSITIFSI